jgi:hypothetical protein
VSIEEYLPMKMIVSCILGGALAMSSILPASAQIAATPKPTMPTIWSASQADAASVEDVRYHRGGRYRHRGHYGYRYRHRGYGYGAAAAAGIIGLGVGAAIANQNRYVGPDRDDAYCFSRFKSYDPRSGTYLGYDGQRHPCP